MLFSYIHITFKQITAFITIILIDHFKFLKQLSQALFIAGFFLTLIKMFFGYFSPFINFSLLIYLAFFSWYFHFFIQIQYFYALLLRKTIPEHFLIGRDVLIDDLINEWNGCPEQQEKWIKLKQVSFLQNLSFFSFFHLIWLRLFVLAHPLQFSILYFFIFYSLIFNHLLVFVPFSFLDYDIISC